MNIQLIVDTIADYQVAPICGQTRSFNQTKQQKGEGISEYREHNESIDCRLQYFTFRKICISIIQINRRVPPLSSLYLFLPSNSNTFFDSGGTRELHIPREINKVLEVAWYPSVSCVFGSYDTDHK